MAYRALFRKKGMKRWLVSSGHPVGNYKTKKVAMSHPKSDKYEYKYEEVK